MQTYLVGGAVRDRLLGLPVRERDWVVVNGTPAELESLGYRRVGASFPVYLHPTTSEEYALARTETKTAPGYRGFSVHTGPDVTLEEDLRRRDLTINAMAETADGQLIDPYGGRRDLEARLLRHVSEAFREDPVRILRVARFAARFHALGFRVAEETLALMREMVAAGEADALVAERVWQETESALGEPRPDVFFAVLRECDALAVIFPEVAALFGVPQPPEWHPEVDTGVHLLSALEQAARLGASAAARFAVLVHDLGKGTTPREQWPRHSGHEERGAELTLALCRRLGVPNRYRDLGVAVARFHRLCHLALELRPATLLYLLEGIDAFRRGDRVDDFLIACEADARGRLGREHDPYPQAALLRSTLEAARAVDAADLIARGLAGEALREALRLARCQAIAAVRGNAGAQPLAG
jgi:tRNA nucleotidyltransferase (CCA-adding enzyme)